MDPKHFADNTYALILLRRGLCICKRQYVTDPSCCAGLNIETSPHFLLQVARVLDKISPHAFAYLEGSDAVSRHPGFSIAEAAVQNPALKEVLELKGFVARAVIICAGELLNCAFEEEGKEQQTYSGIVVMSHADLAAAVEIGKSHEL